MVTKHNYIFNKPVLFKSKDFKEILMILENIYYDNGFNQDCDSKYSIQLLKLIDTLYKIINNLKVYELEIYKKHLSWRDIDHIIFRNSEALTIKKDSLGIDEHLIERQIEVINRLSDNGESINIDDLSPLLRGTKLRSLDNDLKDFIYEEEKFWNMLRQSFLDLSIQEYGLILYYIDAVLGLKLFMRGYTKLYQSLINIKIKILNLFKDLYSNIDYFL